MTNHDTLRDAALTFRSLHVPGRPLVLPNVWDTASARIVEDAGAAAVATTSAGLAWGLGAADGDRLEREEALGAVARIAAVVGVPVSADIESGYAKDPAGIADTVRAVLAAGAVGVNIEDALYEGGGDPLRPVAEQAERIAAVREAAAAEGVPLFVNARIDTFLRGAGGVDLTLERAAAFLAAGADGIFVPGAVDPGTVKLLVEGIDAPLNVMAGPGAPTVAELAALGDGGPSRSSEAESGGARERRLGHRPGRTRPGPPGGAGAAGRGDVPVTGGRARLRRAQHADGTDPLARVPHQLRQVVVEVELEMLQADGHQLARRRQEPAELARADVHDGGALGGVELENGAVVAVGPHPHVAVALGLQQAGGEKLAAEGPADLHTLQRGRGGEGHADGERIGALVAQGGWNARHPRCGCDETGLDGLLYDGGQRLAPL